jgi:hypothetical protein
MFGWKLVGLGTVRGQWERTYLEWECGHVVDEAGPGFLS